ncbi:hypothetical protein AALO_G00048320, partial [Alosa alosa]
EVAGTFLILFFFALVFSQSEAIASEEHSLVAANLNFKMSKKLFLCKQYDSSVADEIEEHIYDIANSSSPDADAGTCSMDDEVGAYAGAGVGRLRVKNGPIRGDVRGPNAGAGVYTSPKEFGVGAKAEVYKVSISDGQNKLKAKVLNGGVSASVTKSSVKAMAKAELASVSASTGPVEAKLGVGFDTGVQIGGDGVGMTFLGTGFNIGKTTSISAMGSELKLKWPFW